MKLNRLCTVAALTVAGLMTLNLAASAQDAASTNAPAATQEPQHMARPHRLTPDQLVKELGLTDDVATKFKAILADRRTQISDLRNQTDLSQSDRKTKMKEIMDATQAKLKDILTPEQLAKLKTLVPTGQRRPTVVAPSVAPPQN